MTITFHFGAPSAAAASRSVFGTRLSMSSVVRTTTGIDDDRQRHRPGPGREMAHGHDHDLVDEQPDDDRRRAQQDVVDKAHNLAEAGRLGCIRREMCRRGCRSACRSGSRSAVITTLPKIAFNRPPATAGRRRHLAEQARGDRGDAVCDAASTARAPATAGRRRSRPTDRPMTTALTSAASRVNAHRVSLPPASAAGSA